MTIKIKDVADLQRTAPSLERHRPEGLCDDACGCVGEPEPAITCTLRPDALRGQLDDWQRLLSHTTRRLPRPGGVRVELDADTSVTELAGLVAAEQDCCRFLQFAITVDTRGLGLEVTGPDAAAAVIGELFGASA